MFRTLIFCLLVCLSVNCFAQTTERDATASTQKEVMYDSERIDGTSLDKNTLEDFKNDPDYNYNEELPEENWISKKYREIKNVILRWLMGGKPATGLWAQLLSVLMYVIIIALLALLIWVFLKIDNARAIIHPNHKGVFIGDDEEIMNSQDIQSLIDAALKEGNYRLAIRYYYLLTLQKLSGKELIDWQVQKTNHEYIYEITNTQLRGQFVRLTDIYDYIWYGNFEVDEDAFAKAQLAFNKINSEI